MLIFELMWNSKNIALFFILLFCSKFVVANQSLGTLFFGEDFVIVKTYCKNKQESFPDQNKTSEDNSTTPLMNCTSNAFVVYFIENQYFETKSLEDFTAQNYFFINKLKSFTYIDLQSPPPQFI